MPDVPTIDAPAGVEIRALDTRTAPEADLALVHAVNRAWEAEVHPEDEPAPLEDFITRCRNAPSYLREWTWIALDEATGESVGLGECGYEDVPENRHLMWSGITVVPGARGKGVARHLLSLIAAATASEGRTLLVGMTGDPAPSGGAFAERLGASAGLVDRESELDLTTIDREMVAKWVEDGPRRAPEYEVVLHVGPLPESEYEAYAAMRSATNDAPRDALDMEDDNMTAEQVAEREKSLAAGRMERWSYLARRKGDSAYAGFTEVFWTPWNPRVVGQGWTAVLADHRGVALGKWLKAAMLAKVFADRPEAEVVRTDNAYSNDPMLGINIALGFQLKNSFTQWQVPLDQVIGYLRG